MDEVQLPHGYSHFGEAVYFLPLVPRNPWYSFYRPRKDERLSRPWSHPVVLNTGPLDWESSTLTTRPLLHFFFFFFSFFYSVYWSLYIDTWPLGNNVNNPTDIYLSSQQWRHHKNVWNLHKVYKIDTITTSMTSFWCL